MISRPQLPPRKGYVEVLDEQGNHVYRMTEEYRQQLEKETLLQTLKNTSADLAEQSTNLELAMAETYEDNSTNFTDVQLALCEIYEMIGGNTNG